MHRREDCLLGAFVHKFWKDEIITKSIYILIQMLHKLVTASPQILGSSRRVQRNDKQLLSPPKVALVPPVLDGMTAKQSHTAL